MKLAGWGWRLAGRWRSETRRRREAKPPVDKGAQERSFMVTVLIYLHSKLIGTLSNFGKTIEDQEPRRQAKIPIQLKTL